MDSYEETQVSLNCFNLHPNSHVNIIHFNHCTSVRLPPAGNLCTSFIIKTKQAGQKFSDLLVCF